MKIIKIKRVIIAIIMFAAVYFPVRVCVPALAEDPPLDMSIVEEFLSGKADIQRAYTVINKIEGEIKKNASNYANYSALGFIYDYAGLYDKALQAIKLEIKYSPEKAEWGIIYGNLAREYNNLGNIDQIRKPAIKSLKFDAKNINSRMSLLTYYVLKCRYREAASELRILSGLDREMDFYYEIYKKCYDKIKSKNFFIELSNEAVKANPGNPLAHRLLGTVIRDSSYENIETNLPIAMQSFYKALELDPKYIPTYISIANTYMYTGLKTNNKLYFNDSFEWLNKAYKLDPKNSKLAYSMGNIYLAMNDYDKGIERLEYAFSHGANDKDTSQLLAAAYNNKAYSYYEIGKNIKDGLKMIDKAILLDPENGLILSTKAELLYKMKRFKEAYEYIQKALKLKPDEPGIKQDLANIEEAMKNNPPSKK